MGYKRWTKSEQQLKPDARFSSKQISRFINCMMKDGKKSTAERIFYNCMDVVQERVKDTTPLEVFETALENVKPNVQVRSRRVGGANYQVPTPVSRRRQQSLAVRWVLQAAQSRTGKPMFLRLADELIAAYNGEGAAMTKRENEHRMAEANRAFAHFAW
jgi:small subunit ribosomal protein S7